MAGGRGSTVEGPKSADVVLVGRFSLQDHNDDDAGTGSTRSTSSGIASSDGTGITGVGSLGGAEALNPLLTAPRITSSSSFARLLTTGGVDGNACNSAAISAGGWSTSLNTKRLESTYLKNVNQSVTAPTHPRTETCTLYSRPLRAQRGPARRARRGRPPAGRPARRRHQEPLYSTAVLACPTR